MGIFLFFLIFLTLILFFALSRSGRERKIEVRGLDGTVLVFTESGITYAGPGGVRFISSSSVKRFSVEKSPEGYTVVIDDGSGEIRVPVAPEEVRKLFKKGSSPASLEPLFPYLPVLTGLSAGLLLGSFLSHTPVIVESGKPEKEGSSPESDGKPEDLDLGNPPENEFDYFDTGEWFDDDQL